jgi:hypothetical protein
MRCLAQPTSTASTSEESQRGIPAADRNPSGGCVSPREMVGGGTRWLNRNAKESDIDKGKIVAAALGSNREKNPSIKPLTTISPYWAGRGRVYGLRHHKTRPLTPTVRAGWCLGAKRNPGRG